MAKDVKDMTPEELYIQYQTGTPEESKKADAEQTRRREAKAKQQEQQKNKAAQDLNVK